MVLAPPLADVYAADVDRGGVDAASVADYLYRINAEATPDVLSRIANQFLATNVAPQRVSLRTLADGHVEVEVHMQGIRPAIAENAARKLDQLFMVLEVRHEVCA